MPDTSSTFTSGELIESPIDYPKNFCDFEPIPSHGFNLLYKARRYGKWYVLKCLKAENRGNPFYEEQQGKEFELGIMLNHPNIVAVQGIENIPELGRCIVMEYVDGRTLTAFLNEHPSAQKRKKVLFQLLDAMEYYHKLQVVHRDLKPSNLLITHNGDNLKVIDFGLSDSDSHTILKQGAGTLRYAAPEQVKGNAPIDLRSDIFSMGVIIGDMFPHRYRIVSSRCQKQDPQRRYPNAALVKKVVRREDRWRAVAPVLILAVLAASALMVLKPFGNDSTPTQPEQSVAEAISETSTETPDITIHDSAEHLHAPAERLQATADLSDFMQWMSREVDKNFDPITHKFEKHKYFCLEEIAYDIQLGYTIMNVILNDYLDQHNVVDVFKKQNFRDSAYIYVYSKVSPIYNSPEYKKLLSTYDLLEQGKISQQQYDSLEASFEVIQNRITKWNTQR